MNQKEFIEKMVKEFPQNQQLPLEDESIDIVLKEKDFKLRINVPKEESVNIEMYGEFINKKYELDCIINEREIAIIIVKEWIKKCKKLSNNNNENNIYIPNNSFNNNIIT